MDTSIKQKLWKTADQLRSNMDASQYKHVVLGLIFLKYISDSFDSQRENLEHRFQEPQDEYYLSDKSLIKKELEDRLYYKADNVFWVSATARWKYLQDNAQQTTIGKMIDDAMYSIEQDNPKLKNILNKDYARLSLPANKLTDLINTISTIGFKEKKKSAKDILGEVYEYFLGMFADAEGKKGGEFFTPPSIVKTLVSVMSPYKGRIYDPCCGSGGMFVQSEKFILNHQGDPKNVAIYGQESNPTTWRLAAMNLAIHGIGFDLGKQNADTFSNDLHPNLKADYILANPPFNISDWGGEKLKDDIRWKYGIPPVGNANYAWLQHILSHLAPTGIAGIVLANGSMSSSTSGEGDIRKAFIENDLVECMVSLPNQLFFNVAIPACLWFLRQKGHKKCKGKILFIDARNIGFMVDRTRKEFSEQDISKIADTYHLWCMDKFAPQNKTYQDEKGFCKSASLEEVKSNDYVLTPGRYVGVVETKEDDETFALKIDKLTKELSEQMKESEVLDKKIKKHILDLG